MPESICACVGEVGNGEGGEGRGGLGARRSACMHVEVGWRVLNAAIRNRQS